MSRPPPIPSNDASESSRRENVSQPQSQPQRRNHGNGSLPSASGDMESLLRQWGASATDVTDFSMGGGGSGRGGWGSTSSGFDVGGGGGMDYPLRIDRSASFDDEPPRSPAANNDNVVVSDLRARHRRVASTGGGRLLLGSSSSVMIPQIFEGREPLALVDVDGLGGSCLSALHDAARITDWPSVATLSESNPESAKYVGPDGWNALHHACDRRCPHVEVIDSLLNAYPEALVQTNDKGWTPLHRACRNKTPRDVVKLLLRKNPELGKRAAAMRCNDGRSSLHYALLYDAPEGVVDLLLQADPGAVLDEDRDGVSPLGTVWDKYANSFDGRRTLQILLRPFDGEGWELGGNDSIEGVRDKEVAEGRVRLAMEKSSESCKQLQAKWKKANTLLRAYFRFPLQEEKMDGDDSSEIATARRRKWRVLHALSAIKCHPTLFRLARALHPYEALEVDENDLFVGGRDVNSMPDPQSPSLSRRTALHFAAMSPLSGREGRNVIKVLLRLNPNAASHVDGHGSLPLHLICLNGRQLQWTNGPEDLYTAYTEASSCRDGLGRTPLHCIASTAGQYTHSSSARPSIPLAPITLEESVIQNLVRVNTTTASMGDNTGRLPLHYIAERCEEWTPDAQSILDAHPAAVQTRAGPSTSNQLPLHMAASSPDARPSLIMNLVDVNPRAASLFDGTGRLPLHLAVDSGRTAWDRGISSIHDAYAPAMFAFEESSRRWTVLHTAAASHSAGRELIEKIISLNENAASIADGEGKYPLHLACSTNRSWNEGGSQAIFDADPSVALTEDVNGLLPFHIAAMRSSVPTNAVADADDSENETLESAAREDTDNDDLESLEVLFNLLIAQPSVVQL
eukprot:CAMPEP_0172328488 /NCGR_PEP_ID=MMETSP1058-20130122/60378_1 /TAXON_ID=83371 /ORGANISM="Detonula confervacea, Strain CCMP 353" /LENGTH=854 /DNA_ID=CAMNT_0013045605 /DNA_START=187 /DNA_END=2754 /DNA_ORIENTATION=-